jgi:hypothetical protein
VDADLKARHFLFKAVGDGGGRFNDNAEDVEACDSAGVLGGLTLSVVLK